jgi:DNA-binding MarR family transcriptional regulator
MTERASRQAFVAEIDRMMRELGWHVQKQSTHTLARPDIDLTLPQMITLFAIHESGTCRMSTLAELTQQSAGTLTGIVDRLIDDALVARVRNTTDRRVVEVTLTPEGEQRLQQVVMARFDDMGRILSHFSDEDLALLERLLRQFLSGIEESQENRLARVVEV